MNKWILVIDSGVGGLTTLARIRKRLPKANVIYFADDALMPYGSLTEDVLRKRICEIVERFEKHISCVVLACNTATGVAAELARKRFKIPIVGTEPAVTPACRTKGTAAVLVTPLEASQDKYARLVLGKDVLTFPQPNLAFEIEKCLIESGNIKSLCRNCFVLEAIDGVLLKLLQDGIFKLVLGCTHYVFLKYAGLFENFLLFDGNDGVAARTVGFVKNEGEGKTRVVFSSGNKKKSQTSLGLLNELLLFDF